MTITSGRTAGRGFTLVELLITFSVVIVLVGLALAGGKKAVKANKSAVSLLNLREINLALVEVGLGGVSDARHKVGEYPPISGFIEGEKSTYTFWDLIAEHRGWATLESDGYHWSTPPRTTSLQNPLSAKKFGPREDSGLQRFSRSAGGYAMSEAISHRRETFEVAYTEIGRVDFPEHTVLIAESSESWTEPHFEIRPRSGAFRGAYRQRSHVMMADGHAEILEDRILNSPEGVAYYLASDGQRKLRQP